MADQSHLDILKQGVEAWNSWRWQNFFSIEPKLSKADLSKADLSKADLSDADLAGADLAGANLSSANLSRAKLFNAKLSRAHLSFANLSEARLLWADLSRATLSRANLSFTELVEADLSGARLLSTKLSSANLLGANLTRAKLSRANLSFASLYGADLSEADLTGANLTGANLTGANLLRVELSNAALTRSALVNTNLTGATLTGCRIYGISAWNLNLEGATQQNLNISASGEPDIRVDNLEVAQFIYLLLNNERIRQVIDTITSKVVLILGRFTLERKALLDALRDALRQHGYLPVLFDFDKPASRDLTETVSTLAHMARFIIADITEAKSIPQELQALVPNLAVPVQPLLLASEYEYGMFEHFKKYPWVLEMYRYDSLDEVLTSLESKIIRPAEAKAVELST
jgi:uncharacterized protein YjbI with pentapeptide repeats